MRYWPQQACEFPNDNPDLHLGAVWVCLEPTEAARAVVRPLAATSSAPIAATPPPAAAPEPPAPEQSAGEAVTAVDENQAFAASLARLIETPATREMQATLALIADLERLKPPAGSRDVPRPPRHVFESVLGMDAALASKARAAVGPAASNEPIRSSDGVPFEVAASGAHARRMLRPPAGTVLVAQPWVAAEAATVSNSEPPLADITVVAEPPSPSDAALVFQQLEEAFTTPEPPGVDVTPEPIAIDVTPEPIAIDVTPEPPAGVEELRVERPNEPAPESGAIAAGSNAQADAATTTDFDCFLAALEATLLEAGAARAAALLRPLFTASRLTPAELGERLAQALTEAGVIAPAGKSFEVTPDFRRTAEAWRGILSGDGSDFSQVGTTTLDQWASELLVACLPGDSGDVRKQLRQKGVAAFGMLDVAA